MRFHHALGGAVVYVGSWHDGERLVAVTEAEHGDERTFTTWRPDDGIRTLTDLPTACRGAAVVRRTGALALLQGRILSMVHRSGFGLPVYIDLDLNAHFVAISDNGRRFALSDQAGLAGRTGSRICLGEVSVDPQTTEFRSTIVVSAMEFTSDGHFLLAAGVNGLTLWDCERRESVVTASRSRGSAVRFLPGERTFASAELGYVGIYHWSGREERQLPVADRATIRGIDVSPDGRLLVAGCDDTVCLWSLVDGQLVQALDWNIGIVHSVGFSADGNTVVAGGDKGRVVHWDLDV